jgi:hypothetical protein
MMAHRAINGIISWSNGKETNILSPFFEFGHSFGREMPLFGGDFGGSLRKVIPIQIIRLAPERPLPFFGPRNGDS